MVAFALSDLLRDAWKYVGQSFDRYAMWRYRNVQRRRRDVA